MMKRTTPSRQVVFFSTFNHVVANKYQYKHAYVDINIYCGFARTRSAGAKRNTSSWQPNKHELPVWLRECMGNVGSSCRLEGVGDSKDL